MGKETIVVEGLTLYFKERRGNTKLYMRDEDVCAITDLEDNILYEITGWCSYNTGFISINEIED